MEEKHGKFEFNEPNEDETLVMRGPFMLDNGAVYVGQWNARGVREGQGSQYWENGTFFTGYWKNDMANGKGRLVHSDGTLYDGEWENDMAHGFGKYISVNGVNYYGLWKCDK